MDSVATTAWLEWWANSSTCLSAFPVSVTISVDEHGWRATGQLTETEKSPDLAGFCELDDVFELRLPDDDTIAVVLTVLTPAGSFVLAEAQ